MQVTIDVALELKAISRKIAQEEGKAKYEFTESDDWIEFERNKGAVRITASYCQHVINCDLVDFVRITEQACSQFHLALVRDNGTLAHNGNFVRLFREEQPKT